MVLNRKHPKNNIIFRVFCSYLYEKVKKWNDTLFLSLETGRDYLGVHLESKGE